MCKISIVIPIYNTGIFLEKCVESVLGQTLSDIEVILVDDGSTDESGKLCDDFAEKDNRIRVIHKINEGVSIARNAGISQAKGEYVGFVDSDDWLEPEMYFDLYEKAKDTGAKIVMCDAVTVYDNGKTEDDTITQIDTSRLLKKSDIHPRLLMEMAGAAWRCIYNRELLECHEVEFPTGLKFSEDRIFNILAMGYSSSVFYTKRAYYNRYMRKGSAVNKYYENMLDIVLDARNRTMQAIDKAWDGSQEYKSMYENQTAGFAMSAINNVFYKESNGTIIKKYKSVKSICKNPDIRHAVSVSEIRDVRMFFIKNRMAVLLCLTAIVLNKKYGR